jgi:hypothetical protein
MEFQIPQDQKLVKEKILKLSAGQRKLLSDKVRRNAQEQIDKLKLEIPDKPSLDNFIISAFLDMSIEMHDSETIKQNIYNKIKYLGARSITGYGGTLDIIKPEDLFNIPAAYYERLKEYEETHKENISKIKDICAQRDLICLKIQMGSNEYLTPFIKEIHEMGGQLSLNNQNSALLIGNGNDTNDTEE